MKLIYTLSLSLIFIRSYSQRGIQENANILSDSLTLSLNSHIGERNPDYSKERSYISRILALDSLNECALYTQARIMAKARQYDSSIAVLNKLIGRKALVSLLFFRGALFEIRGLPEKSLADYKAVIDQATYFLKQTQESTQQLYMFASIAQAKLLLGADRGKVLDSLQQTFATLQNIKNKTICERLFFTTRAFYREEFINMSREGYLGIIRVGSIEPKHDGPIQSIRKP